MTITVQIFNTETGKLVKTFSTVIDADMAFVDACNLAFRRGVQVHGETHPVTEFKYSIEE